MKNIIFIVFFLIFFIFSISCSQDFLDVEDSTHELADISAIDSESGIKSVATSVYKEFLSWEMSSFSYIGLTSIVDDNADKGSEANDDGSDKLALDNLTFNSSSISLKEVFNGSYVTIAKANYAINIIPQVTSGSDELKAQLVGEVKFLRALVYFNLVRLYGGVPIIDHIPVEGNAADELMKFQRKTKTEVYEFIIEDLTYAIANLPDKSSYDFDNRGRASKGSALALMSKVQMYLQNWNEVINNANQITGYNLASDYASIFRLEGEFNEESLFEISGFGSGVNPVGIKQYGQVQFARTGGTGWGFNTPSTSLVQAYESGDLREQGTYYEKGQTLYDGRIIPITAMNDRYNYKAYSSLNPYADNNDINIRVLRYADVLLMKAEAYNELGNLTEAKNAINLVRTRAGLPNTSANNQTDLRLAIWKERRVELAMEHDRWFDLIRTGQAPSAMSAVGKTFIVGKHEVFPIPQEFISQSSGVTTQNPGY
jgi:hypothetical protein